MRGGHMFDFSLRRFESLTALSVDMMPGCSIEQGMGANMSSALRPLYAQLCAGQWWAGEARAV